MKQATRGRHTCIVPAALRVQSMQGHFPQQLWLLWLRLARLPPLLFFFVLSAAWSVGYVW